MLRDGGGWRKGETWRSLVNPDGPMDPAVIKRPADHLFRPPTLDWPLRSDQAGFERLVPGLG